MGSCFTFFNEAAAATTPVYVRSLLRYVKCSAIGLRGEGDYSKAEGTAGGREAGWLRGGSRRPCRRKGPTRNLLGSTCHEAAAEMR